MIDLFAAWAAKEQDTYKNEGNQGNQGNPVEITSAFPVTHPENERVTRVTELPKLPNGNQKGQPNLSNDINKVTQVTQVTQKNTATPREYEARPLSASEVEEVHAWPPETQRVYVRVLDYFEAQGYPLAEAESLALATVKELMRRKRGPVCLVSGLPQAIGQAMGGALDVFGACATSWRPERREVL
ncbi:MAG: hypothetical protein K9K65_18895 [Desulfarculaceae bacterium]|nr:hypothetical protein [Desulfarculaceae bacterium]MCF8049549.1 hypothetical protein [Desulfarculaceae bacterium]MCF8099912.1 hypothetical protein [Desulfarculaceae bacterium]MCF8123868.1 hypothetical protein [Desulfarculaceae bacterium]